MNHCPNESPYSCTSLAINQWLNILLSPWNQIQSICASNEIENVQMTHMHTTNQWSIPISCNNRNMLFIPKKKKENAVYSVLYNVWCLMGIIAHESYSVHIHCWLSTNETVAKTIFFWMDMTIYSNIHWTLWHELHLIAHHPIPAVHDRNPCDPNIQ